MTSKILNDTAFDRVAREGFVEDKEHGDEERYNISKVL
jgi:hypothetical protein